VATQDIEINVRSAATNFTDYTGGFLFIPQAAGLTPQGIIVKLLKQGTSVPIAPGFHPLPGQADVIVHNFTEGVVVTGANDLVGVRDPGCSVFSKGGIYEVYAYLVRDNEYVVSQEIYTITIPKAEAQLTIDDMGLEVCAKYLDNGRGLPAGCSDAELNYIVFDKCNMTVVQNNGTGNADAGFLFVPDAPIADLATAIQTIQDLLLQPLDGNFHKSADPAVHTIVYKAAALTPGQAGAINDKPAYQGTLFKNPATYYVYAWLKGDAGDIFVSDVGVNTTIQIGIDNVTEFTDYTDFRCEKVGPKVDLVIEPAGSSIIAEGGFGYIRNVTQTGFIICGGGSYPLGSLIKNMLQHMINTIVDVNSPRGNPQPTVSEGLAFAFAETEANYRIINTKYHGDGEGVKGDVWVFAIRGQSIVYQKTQKENFAYLKEASQVKISTEEYAGELYYIEPDIGGGVSSINKREPGVGRISLKWDSRDNINKDQWKNGDPLSVPGNDLIIKLLSNHYEVELGKPNWEMIKNFVDNMDKI
jgi:hypothetical protein